MECGNTFAGEKSARINIRELVLEYRRGLEPHHRPAGRRKGCLEKTNL